MRSPDTPGLSLPTHPSDRGTAAPGHPSGSTVGLTGALPAAPSPVGCRRWRKLRSTPPGAQTGIPRRPQSAAVFTPTKKPSQSSP